MRNIFSKYLSNAHFEQLFSDARFLESMIVVEIAIARAQAMAGIIPETAALEIAAGLKELEFDVAELAKDTAKNGIPTIGFLAQAKRSLPDPAADYLHWGVTSQDITDTALVLLLKEVAGEVKRQIHKIILAFEDLQARHTGVQLASRTRNQMAVPMPFTLKVDSWKQPLLRQGAQLERLEPEVFCLQLAGADGQLGILGEKAAQVRAEVAKQLELTAAPGWHSQRDGLVSFADLLARIAATLGKFGQDVLTLSQTEVGELQEKAVGGGSSSMPHKNNPVGSEALVALAGVILDYAGGLRRAQLHKNERDGVGLATEWLLWPNLIEALGAALQLAHNIAINLEVHPEKMKSNLEAQLGLTHSEKATYLLAEHLGLKAAKQKVSEACAKVYRERITLAEALEKSIPELQINWKSALQ